MRVGLPSALLNPFYSVFWRIFFTELGVEVVESGPTTKSVLDKGVRHSVPEICIPIKIYTGHVQELLDRGVDLVYIPRFVSIRRGDTFCPKFLALPDMLKCTIPDLSGRMLTHHLTSRNDDIATLSNYQEIGARFTSNPNRIKAAIHAARDQWLEFRRLCYSRDYNCQTANAKLAGGKDLKTAPHPVRIGVIGYVYNVYDGFISMDILQRLTNLGVRPVTFEMLDENELRGKLRRDPKDLFWTFSNKLWAAANMFFEDPAITGVIHVTAFGCGPDSFLGKVLALEALKYNKPFLTVRVDEHTGESHLQTRIEAFTDMILKKSPESVYSKTERIS
ncbi:MAG TPA: acyl-CoA dehydratase activase-related protein [Bacillota bacterium]